MTEAARKLYDSVAPALALEFLYRRSHASLVSYSMGVLTVCGCFLFGQWPSDADAVTRSWGDHFFSMILAYMIVVVTLLATAHASLSIAGEKEKKTLTLLRMSGLTPFEIIISKIAASACFIAYLILPVAPLALACPWLGGISFYSAAKGFAILAVMTVFFISCGVFISILFKKNYTCISCAAAFLLAVHFGFLLLDEAVNYRVDAYYYYGKTVKYFSTFSPIEMWSDYFESIKAPFYGGQVYYGQNYFVKLDCVEAAALYCAASLLLILTGVKIFERYLKWREE